MPFLSRPVLESLFSAVVRTHSVVLRPILLLSEEEEGRSGVERFGDRDEER